jgi:hypothetical protein
MALDQSAWLKAVVIFSEELGQRGMAGPVPRRKERVALTDGTRVNAHRHVDRQLRFTLPRFPLLARGIPSRLRRTTTTSGRNCADSGS